MEEMIKLLIFFLLFFSTVIVSLVFLATTTGTESPPPIPRTTHEEFHARYQDRTGEEWASPVPRHSPIHGCWSTPRIGHEHEVVVPCCVAKWTDIHTQEVESTIMKVTVLSIRPRVFVVDDFLSDFECDHLIDCHRPHMSVSRIGVAAESKVDTTTEVPLPAS
jgi:hypothetical protein